MKIYLYLVLAVLALINAKANSAKLEKLSDKPIALSSIGVENPKENSVKLKDESGVKPKPPRVDAFQLIKALKLLSSIFKLFQTEVNTASAINTADVRPNSASQRLSQLLGEASKIIDNILPTLDGRPEGGAGVVPGVGGGVGLQGLLGFIKLLTGVLEGISNILTNGVTSGPYSLIGALVNDYVMSTISMLQLFASSLDGITSTGGNPKAIGIH